MVSSLMGDSTTMKERFSGGGGEIDCWCSFWCDEDEEVGDGDDRAFAAVRLIPLPVQGTAAECISLI